MRIRRPHPLWWLAPGAIALRLLMFIGRGDYVAFDEALYLLLGRNLWAGDGFTLAGLRHTALSPLFPILAGGLNALLGHPVWAGRIVAAVTGGLLVVPCWYLFRRFVGRTTALIACGLVAVLPALAPYVAPEYMGWDLWEGAEPVFHLFLYAGLALALWAFDDERPGGWALAGLAFALAYLARPEAALVGGLVGLIAIGTALARRTPRALAAPVVLALGFALLATPYWLYLHDATGRWMLTGRGVSIEAALPDPSADPKGGNTIERMMWQGQHGDYVRDLYALAPSGTRLASGYWGVAKKGASGGDESSEAAGQRSPRVSRRSGALGGGGMGAAQDAPPSPLQQESSRTTGAETRGRSDGEVPPIGAESEHSGEELSSEPPPLPSTPVLYLRAFRRIMPMLLWPFVLLGLLLPARRSRRRELLAFGPLVLTSVAIAVVVAVDPRTQLFLLPVLLFYAARGLRWLGVAFDRRVRPPAMHRGFAAGALALVVFGALLIEDARRVYLGAAVGSERLVRAYANRRAGEALRAIVPEGEPVMSWHPAVALHARRDWRVLPWETLGEVVRYATAIGSEYVVLSTLRPSPLGEEKMPRPFLLLRLSPDDAGALRWRIVGERMGEILAVARLVPIERPEGGERTDRQATTTTR